MLSQEIIPVTPDPEDHSAFINHLRSSWRRWSHGNPLERTAPVLRRLASVLEPSSHIFQYQSNQSLQTKPSGSITVMSANLWHDWPFHRRQIDRLENFARLAERVNADIVLLQEVSRTPKFKADEWLVERLGMSSFYSRANGSVRIGFEEGLAILSRFPLTKPRLTHLRPSTKPFIRRLALGARASTTIGHLWVFSVHLGIQNRQNAAQQDGLRRMIAALPSRQPALLGGDFNAHETTNQMHENRRIWIDTYRHLHPDADGTTHAIHLPWGGNLRQRRLDYIFLRPAERGLELLETGHLHDSERPHSDHHAVFTRLALSRV